MRITRSHPTETRFTIISLRNTTKERKEFMPVTTTFRVRKTQGYEPGCHLCAPHIIAPTQKGTQPLHVIRVGVGQEKEQWGAGHLEDI